MNIQAIIPSNWTPEKTEAFNEWMDKIFEEVKKNKIKD